MTHRAANLLSVLN